jgi:hypothetical protein
MQGRSAAAMARPAGAMPAGALRSRAALARRDGLRFPLTACRLQAISGAGCGPASGSVIHSMAWVTGCGAPEWHATRRRHDDIGWRPVSGDTSRHQRHRHPGAHRRSRRSRRVLSRCRDRQRVRLAAADRRAVPAHRRLPPRLRTIGGPGAPRRRPSRAAPARRARPAGGRALPPRRTVDGRVDGGDARVVLDAPYRQARPRVSGGPRRPRASDGEPARRAPGAGAGLPDGRPGDPRAAQRPAAVPGVPRRAHPRGRVVRDRPEARPHARVGPRALAAPDRRTDAAAVGRGRRRRSRASRAPATSCSRSARRPPLRSSSSSARDTASARRSCLAR